jgi:Tfp pilus assembly protein PilP
MLRNIVSTLACAVILCVPCHAQNAPKGIPFQIDIKDVDAPSLMSMVASKLGLNLVVGPHVGNQRVSISASYRSGHEFIEKMASQLGDKLIQHDSIYILQAGCLQSKDQSWSPVSKSGILSIDFPSTNLKEFFELLEVALPTETLSQEELRRQTVAISLNKLSTDYIVDLVARSAGMRMTHSGNGANTLDWPAPPSTCPAPSKSADEVKKWRGPVGDNCPYRTTRLPNEPRSDLVRRCSRMEFFNVHALIPRGYIQLKGNLIAVLERPDQRLNFAEVGNTLGKNYGVIKHISPNGIELREIMQDSKGEWEEVSSLLRYGVRPPPPRPALDSPIVDGSRQHVYTAALAKLFSATQGVDEQAKACVREFPELATRIQTAVSSWNMGNMKLWLEIDKHTVAYFERQAEDLATTSADIDKKNRDKRTAATTEWRAIWGEHFSYFCAAWPARLQGENSDLEERYSTELETIRACQANDTCPNLW